jgi:acetoin utilization deacetylase AcuC-like enzyme
MIAAPPASLQTLTFYDPGSLLHGVPEFHCECDIRVATLIELIVEMQLQQDHRLAIRHTTSEVDGQYLREAHDAEYLQYLQETIPLNVSDPPAVVMPGLQKTRKTESDFDVENFDTFVTWGSWLAALRAAGAVCQAIDAVSSGECRNAFCAIRPPGHHAGRAGRTPDAPSLGFCLINNVAIGAKYAVLARGYERVAVVDFDVHHGNGTQEILANDDHFRFISLHVYDERKYFFPGTGNGDEGVGNVLNVPLKRHSGSQLYLQVFEKKIIPELEIYQPQLLLLSAGFDAHRDDPTRGLRLTSHDFFTITEMLQGVAKRHCNGKLVSVLEGGYDISPRTAALQNSVRNHLAALMDEEAPNPSLSAAATAPAPHLPPAKTPDDVTPTAETTPTDPSPTAPTSTDKKS